MENYQIGNILHGEDQVVDSCFHESGALLAVASRESIHLIDSLTGLSRKKIKTKTHGIRNIAYTHHEYCVLASSTKTSNDIRYLCMYDNRYLRFFKGHSAQVISLAMSPVDDYFLSSSADRNVVMWSLSSPSPIAKLSLPDNVASPKVNYTQDGLLFGVMVKTKGSNCIRLFDARNYDKGPFLQLKPSKNQLESALMATNPQIQTSLVYKCLASSWESFSFSPDGTRALVNTSSGLILSLDAFNDDGDPIACFTEENHSVHELCCCFSPDCKQILAGTDEKRVRVYDASSGSLVGTMQGEHVSAVTSVKCNPKYEVVATSGINTMLWLNSSSFSSSR